MNTGKIRRGALLLAIVVLPGLADYALANAGYPTVGGGVWALGYGIGVIYVWYAWIRPLELTGPEDADGDEETDPTEQIANS